MREGSNRKGQAKPTLAARARKSAIDKVQTKASVAKVSTKRRGSQLREPVKLVAEPSAEHAAISEILSVMSASPGDVQPVLDAVAERAAVLCDSPYARVLLVEGEVLRAVAAHSTDGTFQARTVPIPLKRSTITGRAVLDRESVHHDDVVPLLNTTYPDAANILRLGGRAVLAVPLIREGHAHGAILLFRREPRPFSPDRIALVETFARQAAIAINNARLFNETREALEQQTAISEILRMISSSPGQLKPMLHAVAERALKLCEAADATIFLVDGNKLRAAARFGSATMAVPEGESIPLTRGSVTGRAVIDGRAMHIEDLATVSEDAFPIGRELQRRQGHRTVLSMPLMREDRAIGAIALWRMQARRFTDRQIALLRTFADQAAIAIENVRLFDELEVRNRDLSESLEQQTATSEILRVMSRSPADVQPVFDTIAAAARTLCGASSALVAIVDHDQLRLAASSNVDEETAHALDRRYPRPRGRDTAMARAIETGAVAAIPDVLSDPEYDVANATPRFRSALGVPLIRNGVPIGAIGLGRAEPGQFPTKQVALLKTFADQAVIAIENVRLFNETKESLERQTATSEILRVISQSPRDVQPVFDTIAAAALKLCHATAANVFTFDGELVWLASLVSADPSPDYAETFRKRWPMRPGRNAAATRAILTRAVVEIPDVLEDVDYAVTAELQAGGFRSVLSVPLIRHGAPIGAISVGRTQAGSFPAEQMTLLQTFADQAVIAIENVRLFTELEARTLQLTRSVEELKALGEVGQAVSSTLDLETVLHTIVSRATQLAGVDGGSIWEYDDAREEFYLHATQGLPDELVEALRALPIRKGEGALGHLALVGEPVEIRDVVDEPGYPTRLQTILLGSGYRSVLAVPLLCEQRLLGALAVNRGNPGAFASEVIELLKTFATQSALAIQNARLFREIEQKSRELEAASRHKSEFLANMSHELRTPLNAIIGFSEVLSERMFGELNEKQGEYISDILLSGQHLLSLINDILDLSKIEAGRMELELTDFDLPSTIENTMTLVRERAIRRGIALGCTVDEGLEMIHADERKVKQVLLNLLSNALKFTPEGGNIDVRAAMNDGVAEVSVTDTGVGIAPEEQGLVFEEFRQVGTASKKVEGTGLGLAISRKFVELHGGRIWVKSQVGSGSTFAFTLPLRQSTAPDLR